LVDIPGKRKEKKVVFPGLRMEELLEQLLVCGRNIWNKTYTR